MPPLRSTLAAIPHATSTTDPSTPSSPQRSPPTSPPSPRCRSTIVTATPPPPHHQHKCSGVLGRDTCEEYTVIIAWVFLEGTLARGTHSLLSGCSWRGHLRGVHIHYAEVFLERDTCNGLHMVFLLPVVLGRGHLTMRIKDCMEKNLEDDAGEFLGVHSQGESPSPKTSF
ncbi:hypothetical protein Tco_0699480 [Tanacetum coccineum]